MKRIILTILLVLALTVFVHKVNAFELKTEEQVLGEALTHLLRTSEALETDIVLAVEEIGLAVNSLEGCMTETCSEVRLLLRQIVVMLSVYIKIGI